MLSTERYAISLDNWGQKKPDQIGKDVASFALEAGKRPLEKRVNPVILETSAFGSLTKSESKEAEDIATGRILQWANNDTPAMEIWTEGAAFSEKETLEGLLSFADLNPGTVMIWISPPAARKYSESRIVIYQTININSQKYLFFRAICSEYSDEECLKIAQELSGFISPGTILSSIGDTKTLRATPLPLSLPKNKSYTGFFGEFVNLPGVWEAIAKREDIREKIKALAVAEGIVETNYKSITEAKSYLDYWVVGSRIEKLLEEKMNFALRSGPCGGLYSDLSFSSLAGVFGVEISAKNYLKGSEGTRKFIHNCGACNRELKRYMSKGDRCPYCGGTYEGC